MKLCIGLRVVVNATDWLGGTGTYSELVCGCAIDSIGPLFVVYCLVSVSLCHVFR